MLDEYRIEPMTVGQYLDAVVCEDIKTDQAVQRDFCWKPEMINGLIYSVLSRKIYVPNVILAEEKSRNGTKQTYVVDGGHRTETLRLFRYGNYKITKNLRNYIIPYNKKMTDEDGEYVRDEYGNIQNELVEFDLRNKTYEDLPQELKNKFNGCPIQTAIYQDCTPEETSELVLLYNNHVSMNASQKALTYVGKYANEIKRIKDKNRFLIDCTSLTESEKKKGVWERVISESVMAITHFDNWKKSPKDICDYLNNYSSEKEYKKIEDYFNRLIPYSDKLDNSEVSSLFTSKNLFVWMILFDKFTKLHIADDKFGQFLNSFVCDLQYIDYNGENWLNIDSNKNTKDKSTIVKKVKYLEKLMLDFLHINIEETQTEEVIEVEETSSIESEKEKVYIEDSEQSEEYDEQIVNAIDFVRENVSPDITEEDIDDYKEDLEVLTLDVDNNSKLLDKENHNSLIALIAYTYKEDIEIDDWLIDFFKRNNTYIKNQKENYSHMKNDLHKYILLNQREAVAV